MRADLHLHTYYSDGAYSPEEIARRAREAGVKLISMTDHDNMEGMDEKRAAAKAHDLKFVPGWEVSSYLDVKVHVLGYNCAQGAAYRAFLNKRKECALVRAEESLKKANAHFGLSLTMGDVLARQAKKDAPLHTMHVVRAFAERVGGTPGTLYDTVFAKNCPAYSDYGRPTPTDAIEVIHACGGLAFLAHPGCIRLPQGERDALINALVLQGLDGIECTHSLHTEGEKEYFESYAARRGLLVSGGSDFHAEGRKRILGLPVFEADEKLLRALAPS